MNPHSFTFQGEAVEALPGETVLDALIRAEKPISHGCKNGSCQSCMVRAPHGDAPPRAQEGLPDVFRKAACFLACKSLADQVEEVDLVGEDVLPTYEATDIQREMLSSDVLRLRFRAPGLVVPAGMFVRFITPSGLKRSYSVANSSLTPSDTFEFHIRLLPDGQMGQFLSAIEEPILKIQGPFGNCTYTSADLEKPIVFIGSGTGLAPLYGVLTESLAKGNRGQCTLYFGGATSESLYCVDELRELEKRFANVRVVFCTDSPSDWTITGSPVAVAMEENPSFKGIMVYTCGHPALVKAAKLKTFMAGASMSEIFSDAFDQQS